MKNPQSQAHALLLVYPSVYAHKILKIMLIKINMAFQSFKNTGIDTIKKVKTQPPGWERYFQIIYLIMNLYPELTGNSYNSIIKRN